MSDGIAPQTALPAIINKQARVLILGSMPSVKSLEYQEYYGHPQNAFWYIMAALCGFERNDDYRMRCRAIQKRGIAVWDVIAACIRPGSLDADINKDSIIVNDFATLFNNNKQLKHIFFNGQASLKTFKKHCGSLLDDQQYAYTQLPSTSPAHASITRAQKIETWTRALSPFLA